MNLHSSSLGNFSHYVIKTYSKQFHHCCRSDREIFHYYFPFGLLQKAINLHRANSSCPATIKRHFHKQIVKKAPVPSHSPIEKHGLLRKIVYNLKWHTYIKAKRSVSSIYIYEACADNIDIKEFFTYFKIPDTFLSWFLIIELHVWMSLARMMAEGEEGRFVRNKIVSAMWEDVQTRVKKLGDIGPSSRKEGIQELADHFNAALLSYDEGLQGDDTVLAAALWRIFFCYNCDNPCLLETLVCYVRKQVCYLESLTLEELLAGNINWDSLQKSIRS